MKYLCRKCNKKHTTSPTANRFNHCVCSCGNTFRLFSADFRCFDFMRDVMLDNFFFPYPQSSCPRCATRVNVGTNSDLLSDGSIRVPEICPNCHTPLRKLQQIDEEAKSGVQKEEELDFWQKDLIEINKRIAATKEKDRLKEITDAVAKEIDEKERVTSLMVAALKNMVPQERIDLFKSFSKSPDILKYSTGGVPFTHEEWTVFKKRGWINWEDMPKDLAESLAEE